MGFRMAVQQAVLLGICVDAQGVRGWDSLSGTFSHVKLLREDLWLVYAMQSVVS